MKLLLLLMLFVGVTLSPAEKKLTVHLVGDSTMSMKDVRAYPETGWGMAFSNYVNDAVVVRNYARNGRSTRSFREEGLWQYVLDAMHPGDYVFVQFGHNDEDQRKDRSTTPEEFAFYLEAYVKETLEAGGIPILLTPVARRKFDSAGNLIDTHEQYSGIMRRVARELDVKLIDMDAKSQALLADLGEAESRYLFNHLEAGQNPNYPDGLTDDTHFNEFGARMIAELVLQGIKDVAPELSEALLRR